MHETKREILEPICKYLEEHTTRAKLIFDKTLSETQNFDKAKIEYLNYINQRYKQLQGIIRHRIEKSE